MRTGTPQHEKRETPSPGKMDASSHSPPEIAHYPTRVPCNLEHRKIAKNEGVHLKVQRSPHQGSVLTPPGFRANPTRVPC